MLGLANEGLFEDAGPLNRPRSKLNDETRDLNLFQSPIGRRMSWNVDLDIVQY